MPTQPATSRLPRAPARTARRDSAGTGARTAVALALLWLAFAGSASAQLFPNIDWKESPTPPPPAFDTARLVEIGMPRYMTLRFGVDPATITVTGDGVVRYVVVAHHPNGGAVNAFYEGVRCATEQMKSYARSTGDAWDVSPDPQWRSFRTMNSSYTKALAQQALCQGGAPRSSMEDMISHLKTPLKESN